MIVVATEGANDCLYCIVAHGAILRIYAKSAVIADQVAANYRKADITPRQRNRSWPKRRHTEGAAIDVALAVKALDMRLDRFASCPENAVI